MRTIKDISTRYQEKIDYLDLELLIAHAIKKPREFVLAHPEYEIPKNHSPRLKTWIRRRMKNEPLAYILGKREFFGLDFKVNKYTLIPRPETELLVEKASDLLGNTSSNTLLDTTIIDIGTGSGNIIISLVKKIENCGLSFVNCKFCAVDISAKALSIAKKNAKLHGVDKKIKFLKGNLLNPILKAKSQKPKAKSYIILANLPYLSKKIYSAAPRDVKKYEPRAALLSEAEGLAHYEKLLNQIKKILLLTDQCSLIIEISPEQKKPLAVIIQKTLPKAKTFFKKDLAGRWRMCQISL